MHHVCMPYVVVGGGTGAGAGTTALVFFLASFYLVGVQHLLSNYCCVEVWESLFAKLMSEITCHLQDPKQADALTKVQAELDETKIILVSFRVLFI